MKMLFIYLSFIILFVKHCSGKLRIYTFVVFPFYDCSSLIYLLYIILCRNRSQLFNGYYEWMLFYNNLPIELNLNHFNLMIAAWKHGILCFGTAWDWQRHLYVQLEKRTSCNSIGELSWKWLPVCDWTDWWFLHWPWLRWWERSQTVERLRVSPQGGVTLWLLICPTVYWSHIWHLLTFPYIRLRCGITLVSA